MAKGAIAKSEIEKRIAAALGEDYIGMYGSKMYTWANDGNDRVQISISLTCPKVMIEPESASKVSQAQTKTLKDSSNGCFDFGELMPSTPKATHEEVPAMAISESEKNYINKLLEEFGL